LFGAYIIGSLEAGIVATTISGYWVQLVEGVVMAASMVLNVVLGEGNMGRFSARIRRWVVPARSIRKGDMSRQDDGALK